MKIFKSLFLAMLITVPMLALWGCGTLDRGSSYTSTYRGFHRDQEIIDSASYWTITLGVGPVISVISMPVDIVIDTVLLPWDLYVSREKERERERIKNSEASISKVTSVPESQGSNETHK